MELEEARDILANCIDDYVISSYCNNTCDEESCKDEDCIFHQAIETILNHITKQEKMIELMAEYLEDELTDDICNKENCYADEYINGHCQKCLNCIKQYFEKKAEGTNNE